MKKSRFLTLCATLVSILFGALPVSAAMMFRITYHPDSFEFGTSQWGSLSTWFTAAGQSVFSTTGMPGSTTKNFGDLTFGSMYKQGGGGFYVSALARYTVQVEAIGTPAAGSASGYVHQAAYAYNPYPYLGAKYLEVTPFAAYSAQASFVGGSLTVSASLSPSSARLYQGETRAYQMSLMPVFSLTDPVISLETADTRLNTAQAGGSATLPVEFQVNQTAQSLVDSLKINYGDGSPLASMSFSQATSLKFMSTVSHPFGLASGQDSRTFTVNSIAYGPPDGAADDDQDTKSLPITVLRSPLAALQFDGAIVDAGSILEVYPGQVLSFHGAPAVGFIEEALLNLDGNQVMQTASASGLADESLFGLMTIPEMPLGSDLLLEYLCTNTGEALNANTWSATLQLVPEPGTMSLIFIVGLIILRRSRSIQ